MSSRVGPPAKPISAIISIQAVKCCAVWAPPGEPPRGQLAATEPLYARAVLRKHCAAETVFE